MDAVSWDDPAVDWDAYHLSVLRSPWDYPARRDEFVAWARRVPRLANPADVVEWNTDKHYLRELAAAGVPVTPTTFVEPGDAYRPGSTGVPSCGSPAGCQRRQVQDRPAWMEWTWP